MPANKIQLPYSEHFKEYRKMDIFEPNQSNGTCLLFIHGGGWSAGNKEQWHDVMNYFCAKGYVCASMSYRLVPKFIFPSQIEDVRLGMQFLKDRARTFNFDPNSIVAVGSSAGGYIAVMLGLITETDELGWTSELERKHTQPQAVIGYCPVVTLKTGRRTAHQLMGGTPAELPDLYTRASPDTYLGNDTPPFLFLQGSADTTTTLANTSAFCHKLNETGGMASLVILPEVKHGFGYGVTTDAQRQSLLQMEQFLKRYQFVI